ncbi:hypothetical protein ACOSP7_004702 [Xanthoceras sorbifolium]
MSSRYHLFVDSQDSRLATSSKASTIEDSSSETFEDRSRERTCIWKHVEFEELSPAEQKHISEAWKIGGEARHVDSLLHEEWLLSCGFIDKISNRRAINIRRNKEKNSKLIEKVKGRMQGIAFDPSGKGKAVATKKPRRNAPKFNRVTIPIPNTFKVGGFKRARVSEPREEPALHNPVVQESAPCFPSPTINEPFPIIHKYEKAQVQLWSGLKSMSSSRTAIRIKDLECTLVIQKDLLKETQIKLEETCEENITLKAENERLRIRLETIEASMDPLREVAAEGTKAVKYKDRLKKALVKIDEYIDTLGEEYVRGAIETKYLKVDPNFYFDKLEEVCAEEAFQPEEEVAENSLDKANIEDSDDEIVEVVNGPAEWPFYNKHFASIEGMRTVVDIMMSLKEMFAMRSKMTKREALTAFMNLRMKPGQSVNDHMMKVIVAHLNIAELNDADIDGETEIDMIGLMQGIQSAEKILVKGKDQKIHLVGKVCYY